MIGFNGCGPEAALPARDMRLVLSALVMPGVDIPALADAYGVSVRTLYRYRGAHIEHHRIGGRTYAFLCRPDKPPTPLDYGRGTHPSKPRTFVHDCPECQA